MNTEHAKIISLNEKIELHEMISQSYDDSWALFVKCLVAVPFLSAAFTLCLYLVFK